MTEYDYSPEAYEAYLATQAKISRWVDKTNRLFPHLGNPFTPATPAVQDSDLPTDLQKDMHRSSNKDRDRDRRPGRDGSRDKRTEQDRVWEGSRSLDRDRDMNQDKHRVKDRNRYRDRGPNHESSESIPGSHSRSHSRPPPAQSKTIPLPSLRAPHSRRASYDQYSYERPKENKYSSSKIDPDSYNHSRYASDHPKPDFSSSQIKYPSMSKYDADVPSSSSTRRHFHSPSTTHLPPNHRQHSHGRASASTQHLPSPASAPPLTSHFQYPAPIRPIQSQTMPPQDRHTWLAPHPPQPPVIPQFPHHPPKGQGYYYARGNTYQNDYRNPLAQPPVVPPPPHAQARGRKVEVLCVKLL